MALDAGQCSWHDSMKDLRQHTLLPCVRIAIPARVGPDADSTIRLINPDSEVLQDVAKP